MGKIRPMEAGRYPGGNVPDNFVDLHRRLGHCLNVAELLSVLADGLAALLPVRDRVSVVFLDPDGESMRIYRVFPPLAVPDAPLPRVKVEGTPVGRVVREGKGRVCDVRSDSVITLGHASRDRVRSSISVPIRVGGQVIGALNAGSHSAGACDAAMLPELERIASWLGPAIFAAEQAFASPTGAPAHPVGPPPSLAADDGGDGLVGRSPAFVRVMKAAQLAARSDADVLITGETGVGKTALACAIHRWSSRRGGPVVTVHLADLAPTIVESELFGHERGAFTGAMSGRVGRFESAEGGTIFLDEIGEATLPIQSKLLRVIQERQFERVGGSRTIAADVRIIAATSRRLRQSVARREFREDLYYRLNVVPLHVPPLRERSEDLGLLVSSILRRLSDPRGRTLSADAWRRLYDYEWPGNIRELECVLRRATILEEGDELELVGFPDEPVGSERVTPSWPTFEEHQRNYLLRVLAHCEGVIEGAGGAARLLGMQPSTLRSRMHRLGVSALRGQRAARKNGGVR